MTGVLITIIEFGGTYMEEAGYLAIFVNHLCLQLV